MQIYAYYVMSSKKFNDVGVYIVFTSVTVGLLIFGKVEGILIIPLEKWKFVHKLRWKKDVVCLIER